MHPIRFRSRWGSLQNSTDPLAGFKGPTKLLRGRRRKQERRRRKGNGRGWDGRVRQIAEEGKGKEGDGGKPTQVWNSKTTYWATVR